MNVSAKEFVPKSRTTNPNYPLVPIVCISNVPPPFFGMHPLIDTDEFFENEDEAPKEEKEEIKDEFTPSNFCLNI